MKPHDKAGWCPPCIRCCLCCIQKICGHHCKQQRLIPLRGTSTQEERHLTTALSHNMSRSISNDQSLRRRTQFGFHHPNPPVGGQRSGVNRLHRQGRDGKSVPNRTIPRSRSQLYSTKNCRVLGLNRDRSHHQRV